MNSCLHCGTELTAASRFCAACGRPASSVSEMMTAAHTTPRASAARVSAASRTPIPAAAAGFAPGTVLAERYRIIGLLGRGGIGEVYRADDLKLRGEAPDL